MANKSLKCTILLIEDDEAVAEVTQYNLVKEGYNVIMAPNGKIGIKMAQELDPDVVVVDWMIAETNGIQVCHALRKDPLTAAIPIIMISSRNENIDTVLGLEQGADDYVTKPFTPGHLIARIRAVLRRIRPSFIERKIAFHDVVMDLTSMEVTRNGNTIKLAPIEFQILQILMENPERVLSRKALIDKVWGGEAVVDDRTIDVHITRVRKALLSASVDNIDIVKTVRMAGYKVSLK